MFDPRTNMNHGGNDGKCLIEPNRQVIRKEQVIAQILPGLKRVILGQVGQHFRLSYRYRVLRDNVNVTERSRVFERNGTVFQLWMFSMRMTTNDDNPKEQSPVS